MSNNLYLIVMLVILCLIFGISGLIYAMLYMRTRQELKENSPWLYLKYSNSLKVVKNTKTKHIISKRSAIWRFANVGILSNCTRILSIKACSIIGFITNVNRSEIRILPQFTRIILISMIQCVNRLHSLLLRQKGQLPQKSTKNKTSKARPPQ